MLDREVLPPAEQISLPETETAEERLSLCSNSKILKLLTASSSKTFRVASIRCAPFRNSAKVVSILFAPRQSSRNAGRFDLSCKLAHLLTPRACGPQVRAGGWVGIHIERKSACACKSTDMERRFKSLSCRHAASVQTFPTHSTLFQCTSAIYVIVCLRIRSIIDGTFSTSLCSTMYTCTYYQDHWKMLYKFLHCIVHFICNIICVSCVYMYLSNTPGGVFNYTVPEIYKSRASLQSNGVLMQLMVMNV